MIGFAGGRHVAQVMTGPHLHQEVELNYVLEGGLTYLAGGAVVRVPARRLAVFWGAVPHQLIATEGAVTFYWFTLPLAWVLQWKMPGGFTDALLAGHFLLDPAQAEGDEAMLAGWDADLRSGGAERGRIAQLEMEARLRRMLARLPGGSRGASSPAPGRAGGKAVEVMAAFIARHYTRRLKLADIAAPTRLHPHHAARVFRAAAGMSLMDYVLAHRLFHARRLLVTTDLKVVDVATESGFGSLSRFNEAFVRATGCAPRAFRRQMAG